MVSVKGVEGWIVEGTFETVRRCGVTLPRRKSAQSPLDISNYRKLIG